MAILDSVIQTAEDIKTNVRNIRDAANAKGAAIGETDALSRWPEKIRNLDVSEPVFTANAQNQPSSVRFVERVTIPTSIDGVTMSNNLNLDLLRNQLSYGCETVIIPEYFINFTLSFASGNQYGSWKRIEYNGTSGGAFSYGASNIREIICPRYNATVLTVSAGTSNFSDFILDAPNHEGMLQFAAGTSTRAASGVINAPKTTHLGNRSNNSTYFSYMTGEYEFPGVTSVSNVTLPYHPQGITIKLPAVQTLENYFLRQPTGTGIMHLYLGPNVSSINANAAANMLSADYRLDIHIPAGENLTKQMLDQEGLTYTQDYQI